MTKKYNYTEKTGRPTKYDPSLCDELDKYLATTGKEQMSLPTKQGFALWLGVDDETLLEWSKIHPEFSATFKKLQQIQAKQLIDDGVYGGKEVNATIIKLLLQNNHGMKERVDTTTNDKELPTPILGGISKQDE
jgi:hypothetical protein